MSLRTKIAAWLLGTKSFRGGLFYTGTGGSYGRSPLEGNHELQLREFRGWVYKCINRIGKDIAGLKRHARTISRTGELIDLAPVHPLNAILTRPNPLQTFFELLWMEQLHAELTGNAYLVIYRNALGAPVELWPLDPRYVSIVPGNHDAPILRYEYQQGMTKYSLVPDDVIHFKYPSPTDPYYGKSPLEAIGVEVDIDNLIKRHQIAFLKNDPTPRLALRTEGPLLPETRESLRESLIQRHTGNNAGNALLLEEGLIADVLQSVPTEMNYVGSRENVRDEIITTFGVHPAILGLAKDINRANAEAAYYNYTLFTLRPIVRLWDEALTYGIASEFGSDIVIVTEDPVPDNADAVRADTEMQLKNGVLTINEVRRRQGLQPVDGGDSPTVDTNRLPVSELGTAIQTQGGAKMGIAVSGIGMKPFAAIAEFKSDSARTTYWRRVEALNRTHENRFTRSLKHYFAQQSADVLSKLRGVSRSLIRTPLTVDGITFDESLYNEILETLALDEFVQIVPAAWKFAMDAIGSDREMPYGREAIRQVMAKSIAQIKKVNDTTKAAIESELREGILANEGIDALESRIIDLYEKASRYRARVAARTAVTQSSNNTLQHAWTMEPDLVSGKTWITSRDKRVRDSHQIDGQTVKMDERFILASGATAAYPGDPDLAVEDVVNERCTMAPQRTKKSLEILQSKATEIKV